MPLPYVYYGRQRSRSEGAVFVHVVQVGDIQIAMPDTQSIEQAQAQVAEALDQMDMAAEQSLFVEAANALVASEFH